MTTMKTFQAKSVRAEVIWTNAPDAVTSADVTGRRVEFHDDAGNLLASGAVDATVVSGDTVQFDGPITFAN